MLILGSEEFFLDPTSTLVRVFEFLGVELRIKSLNLNPKNVAPNKTIVPGHIREDLDNYFAPSN